ncbi:MAG: tyrosine-type recombinase/integrase [Pirellulaceae bacterium]
MLLAKGKANKAEAQAAFHKLMLLKGETPLRAEVIAVATICDLFLDFSQTHHSESAYGNYKHFLQDFCDGYGKLSVSEVKPFHVTRWIDGKTNWKGAKRHAIISVKRVFSWAEQQGIIALSPIRTIKAPRVKRRERVLSADERKLIFASTNDAAFRNFLTAMLDTGCRPSEVARVTSTDVNLELGVWVLQQHKTAKKTGKPRIIYLSPAMMELSERQMAKYPTGPLFPNTRGKPFQRNAWRCRFRRLRAKHSCLAGVVCYTARSTYATTALENGVGIAHVAELLGHTSTDMVMRHYALLAANVSHMRAAAAQATR